METLRNGTRKIVLRIKFRILGRNITKNINIIANLISTCNKKSYVWLATGPYMRYTTQTLKTWLIRCLETKRNLSNKL